MEGIDITPAEAVAAAQGLRRANGELNGILEEMRRQVSQLDSAWRSDASVRIQGRFDSLNQSLLDYGRAVEAYAKFLDTTAANYVSLETKLTEKAGRIG